MYLSKEDDKLQNINTRLSLRSLYSIKSNGVHDKPMATLSK